METGVVYNDATHTYQLDDIDIPSVTTIINKKNPIPSALRRKPSFILATERGSAVHEVTECDDSWNDRPPEMIDGVYERADRWGVWLKKVNATIVHIELPVVSRSLWYAGRVDRILTIDGRLYLIDIKSGKYSSRNALQITGYVMAAREMGIPIEFGMVIALGHEDGAKEHNIDLIKYMSKWMDLVKGHHHDKALENYYEVD